MTTRLNLMDAVFLRLESKNCPQHAAGLFVFEMPEKAPKDYLRNLFLRLRDYPVTVPPFNHQVAKGRLSRIAPAWETLPPEAIDIDYHFRLSALPTPGGELELGILVSRLYSHPLDLDRPLWEIHLIEGLEGGRFGLFMKLHHSLTDGMAGMKMLMGWLTDDATKTEHPPIWAKARSPASTSSKAVAGSQRKRKKNTGKGFETFRQAIPETINALNDSVRSAFGRNSSGLMAPYTAPRSIFNQAITQRRRVSTQSLSMQRLNAICKKLDMTLNDVVLTLIGSALRRYLAEVESLPNETLLAGVLASLRPRDSEQTSGNAIGFIFADLATDSTDPLHRAERVKRSTHEGKNQLRSMSKLGMTAYSGLVMAPYILGQALERGHQLPPMHSLSVSNLPGPTKEMYFDGARMEAMYPLTIIAHGQALLIAMTSGVDRLALSIIACPDSVPHSQHIAVYLEESLTELEQILKPRKKVKA